MPTHAYRGNRRPPTVYDHFLAHPWELLPALWAMLGGALAVVSAWGDVTSVSPSLDRLPAALAAVTGVLLLTGGIGIYRGLFDDSEDLMVGWRRERMGLVLYAAGWAAYGITIAIIAPSSALSWGLAVTMIAASALRFHATVREERLQRDAIR